MKKILFLTNPDNGAFEEDAYLSKRLEAFYKVTVEHPLQAMQHLQSVDGIVIRNIWPTHEYSAEWKEIEQKLVDSKLPTYNPLTGKGDNRGKDYLISLYQQGYPVIPSFDGTSNVNELPVADYYWVKPKDGSDGSGAGKFTKYELAPKDLNGYVIQPFETFSEEPSFYYIDNKFSYAITMPNRIQDRGIKTYTPTADDLSFAQKFVGWDNLPYGIERIDAVRTNEGMLLLTEDEDIAEYLYLFDLPRDVREKVTAELIASITQHI